MDESITYILSLVSLMLFLVLIKKFIDWEMDYEALRLSFALFVVAGYTGYRKEKRDGTIVLPIEKKKSEDEK